MLSKITEGTRLLNALWESMDPEKLDALQIERLRARGYVVEKPGGFETPKEICARLGISESKFARRFKRYHKHHPIDTERGPLGRLIALRSNFMLDMFLLGAKRPNKADLGLASQICALAPNCQRFSASKQLNGRKRAVKKPA